jgi:hypothetical protein
MSDDLGVNLDQLLPDGGQRPMFHLLRQRQGPREVGKIVGQPSTSMAMRFASCQSARLRLPVSSHGLSKASLWSGNG